MLFTFRMIPVITNMLARRGIDAATLLDQVGLPRDAMRGEVTAPLARIQQFVDRAAEVLGLPLFGFDLATVVPVGAYGTIEFLMRSSRDLESALRVLCELAPLINPIGEFKLELTKAGDAELHYRVAAARDTLGTHLNEFSIAVILRSFQLVLDRPLALRRVWFSHARRETADVARRVGCDVQFRAADCGFAVAAEERAIVPRTADAALYDFLYAQAKAQLARVGPIDVVSQVVRVIEARLPHGDVSATAIAAAMATTVRSLQRHLGDAGTTYRDVLAHVRQRRRLELQHGGVSETEIARQLGFADARSMRRSLDDDRQPE